MNTINVAINGFGRIGRNLFKLLHNHPTINVVAINDLAYTETMVSVYAKSFIATTFIVGWLCNNLKRFRPIRPKPLIATLIVFI